MTLQYWNFVAREYTDTKDINHCILNKSSMFTKLKAFLIPLKPQAIIITQNRWLLVEVHARVPATRKEHIRMECVS